MIEPCHDCSAFEAEIAQLRQFAATTMATNISLHSAVRNVTTAAQSLLAEPFSPRARKDMRQAIEKARAEFAAVGGVL